MKSIEQPIYLTERELADRWRITLSGVQQMRKYPHRQRIQFYKLGNSVRYKLSEVIAYEQKSVKNLNEFMED
jgi:hypothetical protein